MKRVVNLHNLIKMLSAIEVLGICLIIFIAFILQIFLNDLPCPLCLLQRIGLLCVGFGFLLNLYYGVRPSHYALSIISAVFTAFVSLRQILLHINDPSGYGPAIFGLHMYTWVFVVSIVAIIYIAIIMSIEEYEMINTHRKFKETSFIKKAILIALVCYVVIVLINLISTLLICGVSQCPADPVAYKLLTKH